MHLQSRTKRGHSRYPINAKFEGNKLSSYHNQEKASNLPETGKGYLRRWVLPACESRAQAIRTSSRPTQAPKMPAQIPTLVQVRWIRPTVPTALPHRPAIRDLKDARLRLAKVIRQVKTSAVLAARASPYGN